MISRIIWLNCVCLILISNVNMSENNYLRLARFQNCHWLINSLLCWHTTHEVNGHFLLNGSWDASHMHSVDISTSIVCRLFWFYCKCFFLHLMHMKIPDIIKQQKCLWKPICIAIILKNTDQEHKFYKGCHPLDI